MNQDEMCMYRSIACRFGYYKPSHYQANKETCKLCLAGQQIDILHLMYDAFMEKRMDKMEDDMHEPN